MTCQLNNCEKSCKICCVPRLIVLLMNVGPIILLFYFCFCNISIFGYLQELLISVESLEFPAGKAEISDVSKCAGDVSFSSMLYL